MQDQLAFEYKTAVHFSFFTCDYSIQLWGEKSLNVMINYHTDLNYPNWWALVTNYSLE